MPEFLLFLIFNYVIGHSLLAIGLETPDKAMARWKKEDPTGGAAYIFVCELWPIVLIVALTIKLKYRFLRKEQ